MNKEAYATFAGGCFWCMEPPFRAQKGVIRVLSGYMGGTTKNPSYEEICSGTTGHREVVHITYDPTKVTYQELLDIFWRQVDPTDPEGQFADKGEQYKTAIYYHSEEQKKLAEQSKEKLEKARWFPSKIVTDILPAKVFYPAEEEHQEYARKNPMRYKLYRAESGRSVYLEKQWKGKK